LAGQKAKKNPPIGLKNLRSKNIIVHFPRPDGFFALRPKPFEKKSKLDQANFCGCGAIQGNGARGGDFGPEPWGPV
jgi:hypothetical protein